MRVVGGGAAQPLILASASPRRRQLLAQLGLTFQVVESGVDERRLLDRFGAEAGGDVPALATRLALAKALEVADRLGRGLVIGADTLVLLDGCVLGKPRDPAEAVDMLSRLQGRAHTVVTGLALVEAGSGRRRTAAAETRVFMRRLDREEVAWYVAGGEPLDKAGAYAIQGVGAAIVERIEGCFYNVVGLPISLLVSLLKEFGIEVLKRQGEGSGGGHGSPSG